MTHSTARKAKPRPKQPIKPNWVIIGIVTAFLFVAALVVINIFFAQPPEPVALNASRVLGQENAPVIIEEFGDFQ